MRSIKLCDEVLTNFEIYRKYFDLKKCNPTREKILNHFLVERLKKEIDLINQEIKTSVYNDKGDIYLPE